ncbi:MAG TPA: hypothetical protein VN611_02035 [Patescibacteria group bacterium]|nr:hypothetical protein [Patescibacteria group bacterium]
MKKKMTTVLLIMAFVLSIAGTAPAAAANGDDMTAINKLEIIEQTLYGTIQTGALVERVGKLETDVYGAAVKDALLPRVDRIYAYVRLTTEGNPSMLTKTNAVEWVMTRAVTNTPVRDRIENLERLFTGVPGTGGLDGRLTKLLKMAYSDGNFEVVSTLVAKDTLIKIKTLAPLSSKQSRVGDLVPLEAADDVMIGGVLIIPKGAKGLAKVQKVVPSGNFGRDARLDIKFDTVEAADGKPIAIFLGDKAKEETKSMAAAAGASVAGMFLLGPVGIIGGAFVNGNEVNIAAGTQMYLQTQNDSEVFGIRVK